MEIAERFGARKLAPAVKAWISEGSPTRGPLCWPSPEQLLATAPECRSLSPDAPEGPMPAVRLAELRGVPLWLALESGLIIALHHDATLYEVAAQLAPGTKTGSEFVSALAAQGAVLKLPQLRSLAEALASWPSLRPAELSEVQRVRAIAAGLGLSEAELSALARKNHLALEFLGLDLDILAELGAAGAKLGKLARGEARVDLSDCHLSSLPHLLQGHPVETLDLSGNSLDWAEALPVLRELPNLRKLQVARSNAVIEELQAALPGVKVRGEASQAPLLSADGRFLDLSRRSLRKLPAMVDGLQDLHVIDLSYNDKLDWEDTLSRLECLPGLEEVRLIGCGLKKLPELHRIPGLRRFALGSRWGQGNHINTPELMAFLHRASNLEEAELGELNFVYGLQVANAPKLPRLHTLTLEIEGFYLSEVITWISRLPALRRLRLKTPFAGSVDRAGNLDPLAGLPLRALHVHGCVCRDLPSLLGTLPTLESLGFDAHLLTPSPPWSARDQSRPLEPFPEAIRGLRGLRELEIVWTQHNQRNEPPPEGLPDWFGELPLMRLCIDGSEPGPHNLAERVRGLSHLQELELGQRCPPIPDLMAWPALRIAKARHIGAGQDWRAPSSLEELVTDFAPCNLPELTRLRSLQAQVPAELVPQLGGLQSLERLVASWPKDVELPVLNKLRRLSGGGGLPVLPALEVGEFRDCAYPDRMPALREIWFMGEDLPGALRAYARWPGVQFLGLQHHWPKDRRLPPELALMKQLDVLRILSSPWNNPGDMKTLREWLPDCDVRGS